MQSTMVDPQEYEQEPAHDLEHGEVAQVENMNH